MIVKVIFENFYLTRDEIIRCCEICNAAGVDFVKTSTGYAGGGAKLEDVELMRRHAAPCIQVKAAGGHPHAGRLYGLLRGGSDPAGHPRRR